MLTGAAWLLQEVKLLERIELACEEQLAATFENYSSLSEDSPSGLAENGAPTPEQPAPALRPAVGLCSKPQQPVYTAMQAHACHWKLQAGDLPYGQRTKPHLACPGSSCYIICFLHPLVLLKPCSMLLIFCRIADM